MRLELNGTSAFYCFYWVNRFDALAWNTSGAALPVTARNKNRLGLQSS
jgi:hypothetical protein